MSRRYLAAAAAICVVGGACDFPHVPGSSGPGVEKQVRYDPVPGPGVVTQYETGQELRDERAAEAAAQPLELRGMVASNAVSSLVIEVDDTYTTVQVTPETQLRVGDRLVGLRELQPGTQVRATYLPVGPNLDLAVEITAEPESVGWSGNGKAAD